MLERLFQPCEESPPGPILRRENADARAIPDLVDIVEKVDDIEAQFQRSQARIAGQPEFMRDAEIDLRVRRNRAGVGEAVAQATAVDEIGAEFRRLPEIGRSGRSGQRLRVIRVDIVIRNIGNLILTEEILVRRDLRRALPRPGEIPIGRESPI